VDSESGFDKYYETVSGLVFDDRFDAEETAVGIAKTDITSDESNAIVVLGADNPKTVKLIDFLENSGLSVSTYVADIESSIVSSQL